MRSRRVFLGRAADRDDQLTFQPESVLPSEIEDCLWYVVDRRGNRTGRKVSGDSRRQPPITDEMRRVGERFEGKPDRFGLNPQLQASSQTITELTQILGDASFSIDIQFNLGGLCFYRGKDVPGPRGIGGRVQPDTRFRIEFGFEGQILDICSGREDVITSRRLDLTIAGVCTTTECKWTKVTAKTWIPFFHFLATTRGVRPWVTFEEVWLEGVAQGV